jgi:single-strand DNA-binding protein
MARSLNKVELIGNLTRDPELRYTPNGTAVCTFGMATNRQWTTETGEKKEEVEFHRIVCWNKLAELCSQFLTKGRKVYVQGRLSTRNWTGQDGQQRSTVEIVIDDMILLDNKGPGTASSANQPRASQQEEPVTSEAPKQAAEEDLPPPSKRNEKKSDAKQNEAKDEPSLEDEINPDDIPF